MGAAAGTATDIEIGWMVDDALEDMWAVLVWNDDVTTFEQVIYALVELFEHTPEEAENLAWTVHRTGKAVATVGSKDEAEKGVKALHGRQIQASMEKA